MPTRSKFAIEQFEEALQKLAHKQPKFHKISTEDMDIDFYYDEQGKPRRVSVQLHKRTGKKDRWGYDEGDYWGFTIESKLYSTSSHATKIDGTIDKAVKFLEELMRGQTPIPRFSLTQVK